MNERLKEMYVDFKHIHTNTYKDCKALDEEIPSLNLGDVTNIAFGLHGAEKYLEDTLKEIKKAKKRATRFACLRYLEEVQRTGGAEFRVQTAYCSAQPKFKQVSTVPMKRRYDEEQYDTIMRFLGVPEHLVECEMFRLNWESFQEWFTQRQSAGQPLPPGTDIHKVYDEYEVSFRKKKEIDE